MTMEKEVVASLFGRRKELTVGDWRHDICLESVCMWTS